MNWEFHLRNFDDVSQWFGIYHAGCGGAPWHDGRPRCWDVTITNNPTGGQNSVYVPSSFVVDFAQWFKVIEDGIEEVAAIGMVIASEGEDEEAWKDAVSDAFNIGRDVVDAAVTNSTSSLQTLMANSAAAMATSAAAVGFTVDQITSLGNAMGLTSFGFIAGDAYRNLIVNDNDTINDGYGWTILRAANSGSAPVDWQCNHAFINQGHLIISWDSTDAQGFEETNFWIPFS